MGIDDGNIFVDHRDRDSLNNRKLNLRPCNDSTNSMNSKLYRTNKSGHKGVRWDKYLNKWTAYIMKNQKFKHLGYYNSYEEAVVVREEAEKKYFGEYNAEL